MRSAVLVSLPISMFENTGAHEISISCGSRKPRAIAIAFIAWFTAPAPTHCMFTGFLSCTNPAIAPAIDAGEDLLDTFRKSIFLIAPFVLRFLYQIKCGAAFFPEDGTT